MMDKRRIFIVIASLLITAFIVFLMGKWILISFHTTVHGLKKESIGDSPAQLWIEVHDVSPGYGVNKTNEITNVIDRHNDSFEKAVLFVIPNHGGASPLSNQPEFVSEIKRLSDSGYEIGLHGYTHKGGIKSPEFKTNLSEAKRLVSLGKAEFKKAGLDEPVYFAPPGWHVSYGASDYIREEFDYTYYAFFIDTPNSTLPYSTNEYTWYNINRGGLNAAKKDYLDSEGIFRLTIHINAANTPENIILLEEFLAWIETLK